jgi:hypothetical protein
LIESTLRNYRVLVRDMNERRHRQGAVVRARGLGWGDLTRSLRDRAVSSSVLAGLEELSQLEFRRTAAAGVRRSGRSASPQTDSDSLALVESLGEAVTPGDPEPPHCRTCSALLVKQIITIPTPRATLSWAVGDTLCLNHGLTLCGAGMDYEPLISSRSKRLVRWGHDWVALCLIVANRLWDPPKHSPC